jgi:hypothetical protein
VDGECLDIVTDRVREDPDRQMSVIRRRRPDVTHFGPGSDGEVWLWFGGAEPPLDADEEFFPREAFTDAAGLKWCRIGICQDHCDKS